MLSFERKTQNLLISHIIGRKIYEIHVNVNFSTAREMSTQNSRDPRNVKAREPYAESIFNTKTFVWKNS